MRDCDFVRRLGARINTRHGSTNRDNVQLIRNSALPGFLLIADFGSHLLVLLCRDLAKSGCRATLIELPRAAPSVRLFVVTSLPIVLPARRSFDARTDKIILISRGGPDFAHSPILIDGTAQPAPLQLRIGTHYRFRLINITPEDVDLDVSLMDGDKPVTWTAIARDGRAETALASMIGKALGLADCALVEGTGCWAIAVPKSTSNSATQK